MSLEDVQPITSRIKQPETIKALIKLAEKLGPNEKLPRMRDLKAALGVTLATLDQAFRQMESRGLIERRGRRGIFISPGIRQKSVGLVFGQNIFTNTESTFYSILFENCLQRAAAKQQRFSFFIDVPELNSSSPNSFAHQDLVDAINADKLDGVLVTCGGESEDWLRQQNIPVVGLNFGLVPWSVTVDWEAVISLGAKALVKQGCRTIGLMSTIPLEIDAFRRCADRLNFRYREDWITSTNQLGTQFSHHERGTINAKAFHKAKEGLPDGLIICNDNMADGACAYFTSQGIRIGKDLKIASHANKGSRTLSNWEAAIIRCEVDPGDYADAMFSLLEPLMDGLVPDTKIISVKPRLRLPN